MEDKKFYIGIDVGTDSVGWAATDGEYNLLRMRGKTAWGAHIFDEAKDAKSRRISRTSGRRLARRKRRIELLNLLLEPLLNKKDRNFLLRLKESAYVKEDKNPDANDVHALFGDKELEKAYHKKWPTIWHLRRDMCENKPEAFSDIRYVYLAIHHIIKYRGNFLIDGDMTTDFDYAIFNDINEYFRNLIAELDEKDINDVDFELINKEGQKELIKLLTDKSKNKNEKQKNIKDLFEKDETIDKYRDLFITLITGSDFDASKLEKESDEENKLKISLSKKYDENQEEYASRLGDKFAIVEYAKRIYDHIAIEDILSNGKNKDKLLSSAFARIYNSHADQLKALKRIAKLVDNSKGLNTKETSLFYKLFYKKDEKNNYASFVGHGSTAEKSSEIKDFNSYVIKLFEPYKGVLEGNKEWFMLSNLAEKGEMCETISYKSTSVIPHQLHKNELKIILQNATEHFPELDDDTVEKIKKIFIFKIPYYYGPLNTASDYSNVVFKDDVKLEQVLPWNYGELINEDATKAKFMNSLTNKCTYLFAENVLPKQSIVYQDYIVLDRLNKIEIDGRKIDQKLKLDLFNNVISKHKKTTVSAIKKYLADKCGYPKDVAVKGINANDNFNEDSRATFMSAFNLNDYVQFDIVERIIYLLTIYTDNPKDAISVIEKESDLTDTQRKAIKSFRASGWGTLSRKLLTGLKSVDDNGVMHSVYDLLFDTTDNFMQIIHDERYDFTNLIKEENDKHFKDRTKNDIVHEMIEKTPPKMRRSLISALKIVDELVGVKKQVPDTISIEVTRENDAKKKGKDGNDKKRRTELEKFLKKLKGEYEEQRKKLIDELGKKQDSELRGKHLYLYFKQLGYDVYTGEKIDINDVVNSTKYDIDHIIPQRLIKDDSLDNLVLVDREQNQKIKKGLYPLPVSIRNNPKVVNTWKMLKKLKAMSDKKYSNLVRAVEISEQELSGFINAQINVINHTNKVLRDILKVKYENTKLIFAKAQYASQLRHILDLPKLRDLNDTHHAVDAYLNVVSGTMLDDRFGSMKLIQASKNMSEEERAKTFNMERFLNREIIGKENNVKTQLGDKIFNNALRHDFLLTYRRSYQDSEFYKATILKAGESRTPALVHTKGPLSNATIYGSYQGRVPEYHVVATIKKTGKTKSTTYRALIPVYHVTSELYKNNATQLVEAIKHEAAPSENETIESIDITKKVYPAQKIKIEGAHYLLATRNENQLNLKPIDPIFLGVDQNRYISKLLKRAESDTKLKDFDGDIYTFTTDKEEKNETVFSKEQNKEILLSLIELSKKPKYDFCPMVVQLRDWGEEEKINEFMSKPIYVQSAIIKSCIALFGRKSSALAVKDVKLKIIERTEGGEKENNISVSTKISQDYFAKSKKELLKNELKIVNDSITGLFSETTKL
ncbi:MAG: type II CRISPR RNA-guided endonuclease Cas9 [Erysipelotrichaceae bacterium]|jgi:CRISPR-associated endonuclease Csn1|nr:type II CRISPR RNA-guided endonuclease Cas9 [Erysipelotrichaceae bacterium]